MTRELVEKNEIGDNADAIWRALHHGHQKLFPSRQEDAAHAGSNGDGDVHPEPDSSIRDVTAGATISGLKVPRLNRFPVSVAASRGLDHRRSARCLKMDYELREKCDNKVESNVNPLRRQFGDQRTVDPCQQCKDVRNKKGQGVASLPGPDWRPNF